jgi:hypothetical protein
LHLRLIARNVTVVNATSTRHAHMPSSTCCNTRLPCHVTRTTNLIGKKHQGPSPSASLSLSLRERRQRQIINAGIWISSVHCCREISTAGRAGRLGGRSRVIYCNASACVASSSAAHILLQRGFSSHLSLDCMYYGEVLYRHSCLRDGLAQGSRSTPRLSMRAIPSEDSLACRCSMALAARQQLSPIQ